MEGRYSRVFGRRRAKCYPRNVVPMLFGSPMSLLRITIAVAVSLVSAIALYILHLPLILCSVFGGIAGGATIGFLKSKDAFSAKIHRVS